MARCHYRGPLHFPHLETPPVYLTREQDARGGWDGKKLLLSTSPLKEFQIRHPSFRNDRERPGRWQINASDEIAISTLNLGSDFFVNLAQTRPLPLLPGEKGEEEGLLWQLTMTRMHAGFALS